MQLITNSNVQSLYDAVDQIGHLWQRQNNLKIDIEEGGFYTEKQRGASHVWYKLCAEYLNDSGFHRKGTSKITGEPIAYPWTDTAFKAFYKDVLFEYRNVLSTEDQSSKDPESVRRIVCEYFLERGGNLPQWPSKRG